MRTGIIGLLHESNTFVRQPTTVENFRQAVLLEGDAIRDTFADAHHEIGGFLEGLEQSRAEIVPVFVARALPSGTITTAAMDELVQRMFTAIENAGPLDGLLVAPHGATVSETHRDADGYWLSLLREHVGPDTPIIGTIDPHANLSRRMVAATDALIAYRSNPHLDQRARGAEAARLLLSTADGVAPTMAAAFPPLAINIERQATGEPHLRPHYEFADSQLERAGVLSNSIVLGFPYADVPEMGTATIVVTDNDPTLASELSAQLAEQLWVNRDDFRGELLTVDAALAQCKRVPAPVCLLDMGDNVGGGSAADGTILLSALHARREGRAFVCLNDPQAVSRAQETGVGGVVTQPLGGQVDDQHGPALICQTTVKGLFNGRFRESEPRHGGMTDFDQGPTAVVETDSGVTVMLTSRRMVPFSLQQLRSCELEPETFDILVAKGVNAPLAAYTEVCNSVVRVDTPGSTRADMTQLEFLNRRRPMYPFEPQTTWTPAGSSR